MKRIYSKHNNKWTLDNCLAIHNAFSFINQRPTLLITRSIVLFTDNGSLDLTHNEERISTSRRKWLCCFRTFQFCTADHFSWINSISFYFKTTHQKTIKMLRNCRWARSQRIYFATGNINCIATSSTCASLCSHSAGSHPENHRKSFVLADRTSHRKRPSLSCPSLPPPHPEDLSALSLGTNVSVWARAETVHAEILWLRYDIQAQAQGKRRTI